MGRSADESKIQDSVLSSEPNTERHLPQGKALENLTGTVENPLAFRRNSSPRRRSPVIGAYRSRVGPAHCPPRPAPPIRPYSKCLARLLARTQRCSGPLEMQLWGAG